MQDDESRWISRMLAGSTPGTAFGPIAEAQKFAERLRLQGTQLPGLAAIETAERLARQVSAGSALMQLMDATRKLHELSTSAVLPRYEVLEGLPRLKDFTAKFAQQHEVMMRHFVVPERFTPTTMAQVLSRMAAPTMFTQELAALAKFQGRFGSFTAPNEDEPGLLMAPEPEGRLRPLPIAQGRSEDPRRIRIDVEVRCSRCGGSLSVRGSSYAMLSEDEVATDVRVVPWCKCLKDWDGTAEDLLRERGTPLLLKIDGEGKGDGVPRGNLVLVEDEDDEDQGDRR